MKQTVPYFDIDCSEFYMAIAVLNRVRTVVLENQLSAILYSDNTNICRSCYDDWLLDIHPMSWVIELICKNIVKISQTF